MKFLTSGRLAVLLAGFATLAVVSPALGGPSLESLVKQEVAKQLASTSAKKKAKRGPAGPAGPAGAAGTARAYAKVNSHVGSPCTGGSGSDCAFSDSKGVTQVVRASVGRYCVFAPGISGPSTAAAVSVADQGTTFPANSAIAYVGEQCNFGDGSAFEVLTQRSGTAADSVGFTILIP